MLQLKFESQPDRGIRAGRRAPVGVHLADGQDANGTTGHEPGCAMSGDSTTVLRDMTWPTWNRTEATGTGTGGSSGADGS
jgi:hypothetical protein